MGKKKAYQFLRYFCFRPFSVLSESLCFDPLRRPCVQWRVYKKRNFLVFSSWKEKPMYFFFTHSFFKSCVCQGCAIQFRLASSTIFKMPSHGQALLSWLFLIVRVFVPLEFFLLLFFYFLLPSSQTTRNCANSMNRNPPRNRKQSLKKKVHPALLPLSERVLASDTLVLVVVVCHPHLFILFLNYYVFLNKKSQHEIIALFMFCAFLLNIWLGPQWDSRVCLSNRSAAAWHALLKKEKEEENRTRRQTRNEDGAGPAADDLFTNYVVFFSPAVPGDGRHTRRLPGGLHGDSSRLPQRKEYFDVHPAAVRLFDLFLCLT